ncbi:hypothetical protein MHBO_005047 [Bonamia ostreae]|uniref:Uncharacterized protein n=1 Tax=Bonamia ostreae TaxID=126728 RepID=A0ABV2AUY3_9EUKA
MEKSKCQIFWIIVGIISFLFICAFMVGIFVSFVVLGDYRYRNLLTSDEKIIFLSITFGLVLIGFAGLSASKKYYDRYTKIQNGNQETKNLKPEVLY